MVPRHWTIPERIAHYTKLAPNGCRLFCGPTDVDGYGLLKVRGRRYRVHREIWGQANGPIPSGMCVCHRCDTPNCVNLDHLFLGTNLDNIVDKVSKDRQARGAAISDHIGPRYGEYNARAKITEAMARAIRVARGRQIDIGREYGISQCAVSAIKRGATWRHLRSKSSALAG